jgi:thiamine thiazole synthase
VIESKVMVSTTGHDGPMGASGVKRLQRLGMLGGSLPGMGALNMNVAEDAVVDRTREIVPGMVRLRWFWGWLGVKNAAFVEVC